MAKRKQREGMPGLFSAAEIRELQPRIAKMWRHTDQAGWRHRGYKETLEDHARFGVTLSWVASAALLGDTSILDDVIDLLLYDLNKRDWDLTDIVEATTLLARKPAAAREKMLELLESGDFHVQIGLVKFLDPERPEELEALEHLAQHAAEYPAGKAREKLAAAGLLDWWRGHFESDPAVGLSEHELKGALPLFHQLVALLEKEKVEDDDAWSNEIAALVLQFPPRAALLAFQPLLAQVRLEPTPLAQLWVQLAARPGAAELFIEVAEAWSEKFNFQTHKVIEEATPLLPLSFREQVCPLLLAALDKQPMAEILDNTELAQDLADLLRDLWPDSLDPKPLLDRYLQWAAHTEEYLLLGMSLCGPIDDAGKGRPWVRAVFEEGLAQDFDGVWRLPARGLAALVDSVYTPEETHALVHQTLERGAGGQALDWAVRLLSDEERLARFDDPRARWPMFVHHLDGKLFARARQDLRRGRLTADEAGQVAYKIETLWGGQASILLFGDDDEAEEGHDARNPDAGGEWEKAHGSEWAGPLNEAEWEELRRLRSTISVAEAAEGLRIGATYPRGPWDARDKAFFETMCRYLIENKKSDLVNFFACVASVKGAPDHLELLEELEEASEDGLGNSHGALNRLRRKLGLVPKRLDQLDEEPEEAGSGPEKEEDDW